MFASLFESFEISREGSLLAAYEVGGQGREVVGYSEPDGIALFDRAADGRGEACFLDRGFFWDDGLEALVHEYVTHALRTGVVPCAEGGFASVVNSPVVDECGVMQSRV